MWAGLFIASSWLGAGVITYLWILGTVGDELSKVDATIHNEIKSDPSKIKDAINKAETEKVNYENQLKTLEAEITAKPDLANEEATIKMKQTHQDNIDKKTEIINTLKIVEKSGLDGISWSFSNLAWSAGWFFGMGILATLIIKWLASLFGNKKQ